MTEKEQIKSEMLSSKQMYQDLEYLVVTLLSAHPDPYAYISKREFKITVMNALSEIQDPMSIDDFYLVAQGLTASIKNGHTSLFIPSSWFYRIGEGKVFPILLKVVNEKVYLYSNYGNNRLPIGSEVTRINGESAMSIIRSMSSYFPRENRPEGNYAFLENPRAMFYMMRIFFRDTECLIIEVNEGSTINTYHIDTDAFVKVNERIKEFCSQSSQRRYNGFLNCEILKDYNTGLITVNSFTREKEFGRILEGFFKELESKEIKNLIIDISLCPGGDDRVGDILLSYIANKPWRQSEEVEIKYSQLFLEKNFSKSLLSKIFMPRVGSIKKISIPLNRSINPNRFKGNVYLLIGRRSCSSSTSFAAAVKYYGFGTLIGEETGDNVSCYGNALGFKLPQSGIEGMVAGKKYLHPSMEEDKNQGVQPDYLVYSVDGNDDAVLKYTLELIAPSSRSVQSNP